MTGGAPADCSDGHALQGELQALLDDAARRGLREVSVNVPLPARGFWASNGFLPEGVAFEEAGVACQTLRRRLDGGMRVRNLEQAAAAIATVAQRARRRLLMGCRGSDALLLGQPVFLHALRHFATARHDKQALLLLHDGDAQALPAALLALVQRLPSVFQLRQPDDPDEAQHVPASFSNDNGDGYFRRDGELFEGELALDAAARVRQQEALFRRLWDKARQCPGLATIGAG